MELVAPLKLLINTNLHRFYQRTHKRELNWATNICISESCKQTLMIIKLASVSEKLILFWH